MSPNGDREAAEKPERRTSASDHGGVYRIHGARDIRDTFTVSRRQRRARSDQPRPPRAAEDPARGRSARGRRGHRVPDRHGLRARLRSRSTRRRSTGSTQIKQMDRSHQLAFICPDLVATSRTTRSSRTSTTASSAASSRARTASSSRRRARSRSSSRRKRKTVGIRIPDHEVIRAITRELGRPVISTTAQMPGEEPHVDPREIDRRSTGSGSCSTAGGGGVVPTTVVDLTQVPPVIVARARVDRALMQ